MPPRSLRDLDPGPRFEMLSRLTRRISGKLRGRPDILFVGFGRRQKGGRVGHQWCVKVYVQQKLADVPEDRRIPAYYQTSLVVGGKRRQFRVPTDVHELPDFHATTRPMAAPVAYICNDNDRLNYGTATAIVRMASTGQSYLLSAAHVLARTEATPPGVLGERIVDENGGLVGTLAQASDVRVTKVDAALCTLNVATPAALLQRGDFGAVAGVCPVEQVGADGTNFTMLSWVDDRYMYFYGFCVDFAAPGYAAGPVTIPLVMHFGCGAEPGDSGALVVDAGGRAVGMHLWGREGTDSFCLPIEVVLGQAFSPESLVLIE